MNSKRLWRIAGIAAFLVVVVFVVSLLRNSLTPVFIAVFLAYLLDPVVDKLEERKINRSLAILMLAGLVVAFFVFIGSFLVIQAQRDLVELHQNLPKYKEKVGERAQQGLEYAGPFIKENFGVDTPKSIDELVSEVKNYFRGAEEVDGENEPQEKTPITEIAPAAFKPFSAIVTKLTSSTLAFVSWLFGLIIIPVFLFYFLRDWDTLKLEVAEYLPHDYRGYIVDKVIQIDEILGAFIRGQLTICTVLGVLYSIGLLILGVDMAVVIGMLAGIGFIVPYLGTVIGVGAALIMVILEHGASWHILGVAGVFGGVQLFEGIVLTPKVMGDKVGLSPVVVIFSLLAGAELMGLTGMLVAVPCAAVIKVFIDEGFEKYKSSEFFLGSSKKKTDKNADDNDQIKKSKKKKKRR
jgi:predicted PurR-regulated permease PerM